VYFLCILRILRILYYGLLSFCVRLTRVLLNATYLLTYLLIYLRTPVRKVVPGVFVSLPLLEGDAYMYVPSCHSCVSVELLQSLQRLNDASDGWMTVAQQTFEVHTPRGSSSK